MLCGGSLCVFDDLNGPNRRTDCGLGILESTSLYDELLTNGKVVYNSLVEVIDVLSNLEEDIRLNLSQPI